MKKVDANHKTIVDGLRSLGASVQSIASIGRGCPDLLVGFRSRNLIFEVKDGAKFPSQRRLTIAEEEWQRNWRGQVHTIHNLGDAIAILTNSQHLTGET